MSASVLCTSIPIISLKISGKGEKQQLTGRNNYTAHEQLPVLYLHAPQHGHEPTWRLLLHAIHLTSIFSSKCVSSRYRCILLADQAVHRPGFPLACPRAEAPVMAASPAAQRAQAPLVAATHLSAPGPVTPCHPVMRCAPVPQHGAERATGARGLMHWESVGTATQQRTDHTKKPPICSAQRTRGCSRGRPALPAAASAPAAALKPPYLELKAQTARIQRFLPLPPYQNTRKYHLGKGLKLAVYPQQGRCPYGLNHVLARSGKLGDAGLGVQSAPLSQHHDGDGVEKRQSHQELTALHILNPNLNEAGLAPVCHAPPVWHRAQGALHVRQEEPARLMRRAKALHQATQTIYWHFRESHMFGLVLFSLCHLSC